MRINIVRLRKRFDDNKNIIDVPTAQELLKKGQHELWANQHYSPHQFPSSPGGTAFDRDCFPPDWVLDSWHPLEKAQYPKYFAKREERKKEYIALWEKRWGKPFIPHDEH
uniref:NADH dehydrogenase [ubiquinone] 1 beta subcomplex subunit 9 n=1 Tax=Schizaphis graminum TaxID=13262 RepID=A0A2S2N826_SCHGA